MDVLLGLMLWTVAAFAFGPPVGRWLKRVTRS